MKISFDIPSFFFWISSGISVQDFFGNSFMEFTEIHQKISLQKSFFRKFIYSFSKNSMRIFFWDSCRNFFTTFLLIAPVAPSKVFLKVSSKIHVVIVSDIAPGIIFSEVLPKTALKEALKNP